MNELILTSLQQGLIFAILGMGVYITFRILDFPDMSVEGTFPLGAFLFARLVTLGLNAEISTILSMLIGSLAGIITYILHIKLKINSLLSGILTMSILYSINLRINNTSNIPLFNQDSIFELLQPLIVLIIIIILVKLLTDLFFKTELGYLIVATGDNKQLVKSLGKNTNKYILIGLMISNGLVALSGALMSQLQGFVDISMGSSIIVIALASIIIGETLFKNSEKIKWTTKAFVGAIIYKVIGSIAIELGLAPTDLKAINALIVIIFLSYNTFKGKIRLPNFKKREDAHVRD